MGIGKIDSEYAVREGWARDSDDEIYMDGYNAFIQVTTRDGTSGFQVKNDIGAVAFSSKSDGDGYVSKRLGVGTYFPQTTLEVIGKSRTDQLQVTENATAGYVLTADGDGNATWQAAGASADVRVKISANDTATGYLFDKLVAGASITLTELNDGGNETLRIDAYGAGFDIDLDGYVTRPEWDQNGFENRTDSTLTWTDSSPDRTLSIQPTSTSFDYWVAGARYTSTGDTVQITDTEGIHVIYYDDDTLTALANPTSGDIDTILRTKCLASVVYWDTSASTAIYVGEERHGANMAPNTHAYLHFINGLKYLNGLGLNTIDADQNGNSNSHAQFGVDAGAVSDEDLYLTISAITSTTGLPIYYMTGASADWNKNTNAGYSVLTAGTGRLAWNEYTGGAWQLSEATNNDYVLCHVFATTEKDNPLIAIVGQNEYINIADARTGAESEVRGLVLNSVLTPEMTPVASVIFHTKNTFSNAVKARVVATEDGDNYIDWRNETIARVELSTSNHNSLNGLQGGIDGQYYHLTNVEHANLAFKQDLDGYAWDQTVSEHYTQHSEAIQTVVKELDGYLWEEDHRPLDELVHLISEDSFEEITYDAGNKVTTMIIWTDSGKTTKIREEQYTYDSWNKVTQILTIQYNSSGTEVERMAEDFTYDGNRVTSIVRDVTIS